MVYLYIYAYFFTKRTVIFSLPLCAGKEVQEVEEEEEEEGAVATDKDRIINFSAARN